LRGTSIGCVEKIAIGPHSLLDGAHIIDADLHPKDPTARLENHSVGPSDPITIGFGSYIGPHTVLMKGASIGDHVRVMAGSCLGKKSVGNQSTVRGSPASIHTPRPS
jgi:acetyltransferase-like isoleucine patch superfamily enzyme